MKNSVFKKFIIVVILIVMTTNFIMPKYVYAKSIQDQVVSGIFYLVAYVGDAAMMVMQKLMVGTSDLMEYGEYKIKYSPGIIFSNVVPALDINFISATADDDKLVNKYTKNITTKEQMLKIAEKLTKDDFSNVYEIEMSSDYDTINEEVSKYGIRVVPHIQISQGISYVNGFDIYNLDNKQYNLDISNMGLWGAMNSVDQLYEDGYQWFGPDIMLYTFAQDASSNRNIYKIEKFNSKAVVYEGTIVGGSNALDRAVAALNAGSEEETKVKLKSTAFALKDNIARWYIALRTLALVGLLSVLLYLGIRIILSSASAQDKAKYKNMIKDWLVAICILFVLHYLMAFMLGFVDKINDMFSSNVLTDSVTSLPSDGIMSTVRTNIGDSLESSKPGLDVAGYTIMYLVLVILTISFTFQYLKRVVYMAFLTMIAPLIALTYPIDKVKDGKAQAFSFWLKEYIVNCLIQPVHLLLYTLLVTNALEFATENVLYAIVAITFLMPAEKIIKQMFGINSQSSYNTLNAAAGGAMVMNMLNKAKGLGPKGGSKGDAGSGAGDGQGSQVRTATRNGMNTPGATTGTPAPGAGGGPLGGSGSAAGGSGGGSAGGSGTGGGSGGSAGGTSGGSSTGGSSSTGKPGVGRTAWNVAKRIAGPDRIKSAGRWMGRNTAGAVGGIIGATAAIADGQADDLFVKAAAGAAAGSAIGDNILNAPGAIAGIGRDIKEDVLRGAMGDEAYENAQFDKKFYKSDGYKKIVSSSTLSSRYSAAQIKQQTQMFLDNGITDAGKIQEALEAGVNGDEYKSVSDMGVDDIKKYSKIRRSKSRLGATEIASRMAIAKNMPTELYDDKNAFVRYAKRYGIGQADAETLFREIDDFA